MVYNGRERGYTAGEGCRSPGDRSIKGRSQMAVVGPEVSREAYVSRKVEA